MRWRLWLGVALLPLPSFLKVLLYRHVAGYRIGRGVRIGLSVIAAEACQIGDATRIGHLNLLAFSKRLSLGSNVAIGHFNLILGGEEIALSDGVIIARFNEINSILKPLVSNSSDPRLIVGRNSVITAWHKIDFTDRVTFGANVVFAGRNSCIWTHNRQQVRPVSIGDNCYLGSGIQMAPGSTLGAFCVLGLGSVVTKPLDAQNKLVAGMPAKVIKELDGESQAFVAFSTRPDLDGVGG